MREIAELVSKAPEAAVLALCILPMLIGETVINIKEWIDKKREE